MFAKRLCKSAIGAAAAICATGSAQAAVKYELDIFNDEFSLVYSEVLSGFLSSSHSSSSTCTTPPIDPDVPIPGSFACTVSLFPDSSSAVIGLDPTGVSDASVSSFFAAGALGHAGDYTSVGGASGRLIVSTIASPPPPSAVPEPGTWAMMIAGIGMVGAALRRRACIAVRHA